MPIDSLSPQADDLNRLNVIHITGTKGKGSTSAFVDSLVRSTTPKNSSDGRPTTGLYTSPHLVQVRERIRLDGKPIPEDMFAKYFWQVWDRLQQNDRRANPEVTPVRPVYFRYLTILAYHIFLTLQVKCTISEVGIGGRFDSTNIVPKPIVAGITTLGLDHTALLGNTIEEIAYQKAGIFKAGCPALSVSQSRGAERVLEEEASKVGVSVTLYEAHTA
jgi:folylpolyglutamate synthase